MTSTSNWLLAGVVAGVALSFLLPPRTACSMEWKPHPIVALERAGDALRSTDRLYRVESERRTYAERFAEGREDVVVIGRSIAIDCSPGSYAARHGGVGNVCAR